MNPYLQKDLQHLWHPFTQMSDWHQDNPLIIERGEGNFLIDIEGKKYLDGISSLWVTIHGHRKKEIDEAIKQQVDKISHSTLLGLSNVPAIELAEKLVAITPTPLTKVFYSDSGSTAVEIALKIAFQYWQHRSKNEKHLAQKTRFLSFSNAYHGDTIGSVSLGGIELFHSLYQPLLFQAILANFENIEMLIEQHAPELAAVIIEPLVQGAAGMILQPKGFLKKLRTLCDQHNVLLIFDEVATGFGRTGKMFACEHDNLCPDILCCAKGITGGYLPLAATLTTEKIFEAFLGRYEELKTFFHGHTYTGNPLACAAAIANLTIFQKEKVLDQMPAKIQRLERGLEKIKTLEHVAQIRQCGFMVGIELMKDVTNNIPYPLAERIGHQVILKARQKGVILRPLGAVIVLMPPLSLSDSEMDLLLDATYQSIHEVTTSIVMPACAGNPDS